MKPSVSAPQRGCQVKGREVVLYPVILLSALLLRLLGLGTFITWDEPMWTYRSIRFLAALLKGNFAGTFLVGHPGVITMICGALGIAVWRLLPGYGLADFNQLSEMPFLDPWDIEAIRKLAPFLLVAKIPLAVLNAFCIVCIYSLTKRLFNGKTALIAAFLLILDPFHLALSRVLHLDAIVTDFMMLSVLSLLLYIRNHSGFFLVLSGATAGLAFLNKSYSLFLIPFTGLLLVVAPFKNNRPRIASLRFPLKNELKRIIVVFSLWCFIASFVFFALWPAMWVTPVSTIQGVIGTALGYATTSQESSKFFLGKIVESPGLLFYPVVLSFRITPLVWLGLLAALLLVRARKYRQFEMIALLAYAALFTAFMSLGVKKFDRYMLPAIVALDTVAAVGLGRIIISSTRRVVKTAFVATFILQGLFILSYHPYYFAFYNPLLGGPYVASKVLPVGWGEGIDIAARYLNRKENAGELIVTASGIPGFAPLFKGTVQGLSNQGLATSDYALVYISEVQHTPGILSVFKDWQLEYIVNLHNINYVWIFSNVQHAKLASFLEGQVGPRDVVILDAPSALLKHYKGPSHIIDANRSEDELIKLLNKLSSGHRHLWYIAYPEGDPKGWIKWQLNTHALLLERWNYLWVSVYHYLLTSSPSFKVTPLKMAPGIEFGGRLKLIGYGFTDYTIEYRQKLGVLLRWQAVRKMGENYALSLRLVDEGGHSWAQVDKWLLNAAGLPTSTWAEGEENEGRYLITIPPGIPPGIYKVQVIVYQTDTMNRLTFLDEKSKPGGTNYTLGEIEIITPTVPPTPEELTAPYTLNYEFGGDIKLWGYDLPARKARPGDTLELTLFWQALRTIERDYNLLLELRDENGESRMKVQFPLPNEFYPTNHWRPGERLKSIHSLLLDPALQGGRYRLLVNLLDNGRPVGKSLAITELDIEGREHLFIPPQISHPLRANIAHSILFLGYDLDRTNIKPNEALHLTLYWQAKSKIARKYTVFVHLLDAEGRIRGQKDNPPCNGLCPTTSWLKGEIIVDKYEIMVPPDTPAGELSIEVGMYDPQTLHRLPVFDETGQALPDNRILLDCTVTVEGTE